ncbi:ATP-binding cassette domain-containing protein, partial [Ochrobactrum sp. SFR4]
AGKTLALVGESGSGKSVTSLAVMGLLPEATGHATGSVRLGDTELLGLSENRMRSIRGSQISMIFQEPMTSLNPVQRIGDQLAEVIRL